jgi:hypothetical protein
MYSMFWIFEWAVLYAGFLARKLLFHRYLFEKAQTVITSM